MRWNSGRKSDNIEDYRSQSGSGGFRPRLTGPRSKMGIGGIIFVFVAYTLLGGNPIDLLQVIANSGQVSNSVSPNQRKYNKEENDQLTNFVSVMLADTEDVWSEIFKNQGYQYKKPRLVLFSNAIDSACGYASSASGPFYCPSDQKVYLDLSFLNDLKQLGVDGDFPLAYVIAHEIGHHVQNLQGRLARVQKAQTRSDRSTANALQVGVELQADCYAGVWTYHSNNERKTLEAGDIEEGIQAAKSIGDDNLQKRAGQTIQPESFTHGSSQQRVNAFKLGFKRGSWKDCKF